MLVIIWGQVLVVNVWIYYFVLHHHNRPLIMRLFLPSSFNLILLNFSTQRLGRNLDRYHLLINQIEHARSFAW